MVRVITTKL